MNIIPFVTEPGPAWVGPLFAISLFLLLIVGGFNIHAYNEGNYRTERTLLPFSILLIAGTVIGGGGMVVDFMRTYQASATWTYAVRDEVEDVYGLRLTSDQLFDLRFPAAEPEEDFAVFGSITMDMVSGDVVGPRPVSLVWSDGELLLARSVDGENVIPLEVR